MNEKAAVFACHFTGVLGILASCLMWKIYGPTGFILGLVLSTFWFILGVWIRRQGGDPQAN
ncbi:hypothetical protein SAMN05444487_11058 [Marininema mesophilum]|uniref:Uncharacterized protein n=1 Tax=Marininema mesophilum TaxID=1048340 RepID=A0A1H2YYP7_9BACL|nr:hypothetical protein [Marininema mesophilum]SDX10322.1 hypothetical protein SAMN05444487_11058 [Marininema mesophilum]